MPLARAKYLQKQHLDDKTVYLGSRWSMGNDRWLNKTAAFVPFRMPDLTYWCLLCYYIDGPIKIFKLDYDQEIFGAWPQPVLPDTRLPAELNFGMMPFIATPYMLYQNANGNDQYASLVTVTKDTNGVYTVNHDEINGLPVSDDVQLVPLQMLDSPDLYVAAYNDNMLSLYKIDPKHKRAHKVGSDMELGDGWGSFTPLGDGSSFIYLNPNTGAIGAGEILDKQLSVKQLPGTPLAGYDSLAALIGNGGPTFVAYSFHQNITPQIFTLLREPLRISPKPSVNWPPNISSIATFDVTEDRGQIYYLITQHPSGTSTFASTRSATAASASPSSSLMIASGMKPGYPED